MKNSIKTPFAIDSKGNSIRPNDAEKFTDYYCPSCKSLVRVKKGPKKIAHFFHLSIPNRCDFINETEEHLLAKLRIAEIFEKCEQIIFLRHCAKCKKEISQAVQTTSWKAKLECKVQSGHIVDVAIFDTNMELRSIIEVFHRHEVDEEKREALTGIPWAEINATVILSGNKWQIKRDCFKKIVCKECIDKDKRIKEIKKKSKFLPFVDKQRLFVTCPMTKSSIHVVDYCSECCHFAFITTEWLKCTGE